MTSPLLGLEATVKNSKITYLIALLVLCFFPIWKERIFGNIIALMNEKALADVQVTSQSSGPIAPLGPSPGTEEQLPGPMRRHIIAIVIK